MAHGTMYKHGQAKCWLTIFVHKEENLRTCRTLLNPPAQDLHTKVARSVSNKTHPECQLSRQHLWASCHHEAHPCVLPPHALLLLSAVAKPLLTTTCA